MNEYKVLSEIIELCLYLDIMECKTYYKFHKKSHDPEIKEKWLERCEEERGHIRFWREAFELSKKEELPLVFKNPLKIRDRMREINKTINTIMSNFNSYDIYSEQLTLAFMLESYTLSPTFMTMFRDYSFIDKTIYEQYQNHILAFVNMIKKYHHDLSLLQVNIFSENLYDLYCRTKEYLDDALHDNLTNLYNRHGFTEQIRPLLSLAERKRFDAGIIILDFDDFKKINDSHGHAAGDAALKAEALIINSFMRESSIVGRYGGDEFIIFTEVDDLDSLKNICERIRKTTEEKSEELAGFPFTISIGAAKGEISRPHEKYIAQIINDADQKLYRAKSKGKNTWVV